MANNRVSIFFLLSVAITSVVCQTFQYSRGWTNGKRTDALMSEDMSPELKFTSSAVKPSNGQFDNVLANSVLQKFKLFLQGAHNDQAYLLPCQLLNSPKRNIVKNVAPGQFQHAPATLDINGNY